MRDLSPREIKTVASFDKDTHLRVLAAFLCDGRSHRAIQREILGIPANPHGGGFITMSILHSYGIPGTLKGRFRGVPFDAVDLRGVAEPVRGAVKKAVDFRSVLTAQMAAIREGRVSIGPGAGKTRSQRVREYATPFREVVLDDYGRRCALCDISLDKLLISSHIIPWTKFVEGRLDPRNAIALCALHDKLFDSGLISFTDGFEVIVSPVLLGAAETYTACMKATSKKLRMPREFPPGLKFLAYHRRNRFVS